MSTRDELLPLRSHLSQMPDAPPIFWENEEIDKIALPHLIVTAVPTSPRRISLGLAHDLRGILQIAIRVPAGSGSRQYELLAKRLQNHFFGFVSDTLRVDTLPAVLTGYPDGSWYRVPVHVTYRRLGVPIS